MSDENDDGIVLYDDGHWKITQCLNFPAERLHIYNAHTEDPLPKCWHLDTIRAFHRAVKGAIAKWIEEVAN